VTNKQQKSDNNGKFHSTNGTKANPKLHRELLGKGNVIDMNWQGNLYLITLLSGRAPSDCTFHTTFIELLHFVKYEKNKRA
jgi:hypothetical protein